MNRSVPSRFFTAFATFVLLLAIVVVVVHPLFDLHKATNGNKRLLVVPAIVLIACEGTLLLMLRMACSVRVPRLRPVPITDQCGSRRI